jgi:alpha-N-arabinofuranosidase
MKKSCLVGATLTLFTAIFVLTLVRPPAVPAQAEKQADAIPTLIVNAGRPGSTINKNIYGHFSEHLGRCIYEGYWVGEDSAIPNTRGIRRDVVAALRAIRIPVLRWPGGCFADTYHWKDGVGPRGKRPSIVNTNWGGVTENNHFGTHEFLDLCDQLGCEPYFCGNVGSGTVREMQEWVEYVTFAGRSPMADWRRSNGRGEPWKLPFFGVGNESWGCGGSMRPDYYSDVYRRYQTYLNDYSGNKLFRIACGPGGDDYAWTETLMEEAGRAMDGLSLHYYTVPGGWNHMGSATEFGEAEWFDCLKRALLIEEYIREHTRIMDNYDPDKRVALVVDEWGTWYRSEPGSRPGFLYQQNSLRDAVMAGLTLNIFNEHSDRVRMANIAQTVNVLQAMILTRGREMILTPTYWVFEMYKVHQGATRLSILLRSPRYDFGSEAIPALSASASRDKDGRIHVSLCNLDPNAAQDFTCEVQGVRPTSVSGRVLTARDMTAHNTFEKPEAVKPAPFDGARLEGNAVRVNLPPKSVVVLEII